MAQKAADLGFYVQDQSGLWHYTGRRIGTDVIDCARDALAHRPEGPAWFWFNGTFAPMVVKKDSPKALAARLQSWKGGYRGTPFPGSLLPRGDLSTSTLRTKYILSEYDPSQELSNLLL
jgi:hypothetical protein